jgi:hypothetical protein
MTNYETIDDLISVLQDIRKEYGNLPVLHEYDGDHWIGGTIRIEKIEKGVVNDYGNDDMEIDVITL